MRVLPALFKHETHTFSSLATNWHSFGVRDPLTGAEVILALAGTNPPRAASIDFARAALTPDITRVLLDLHGAMDAAHVDAADAELVSQLRHGKRRRPTYLLDEEFDSGECRATGHTRQ